MIKNTERPKKGELKRRTKERVKGKRGSIYKRGELTENRKRDRKETRLRANIEQNIKKIEKIK